VRVFGSRLKLIESAARSRCFGKSCGSKTLAWPFSIRIDGHTSDPRSVLRSPRTGLPEGWSCRQTAKRFMVEPDAIAEWMGRVGEEGESALVKTPESVRGALQDRLEARNGPCGAPPSPREMPPEGHGKSTDPVRRMKTASAMFTCPSEFASPRRKRGSAPGAPSNVRVSRATGVSARGPSEILRAGSAGTVGASGEPTSSSLLCPRVPSVTSGKQVYWPVATWSDERGPPAAPQRRSPAHARQEVS
jgi:hypothetical protein